MKTVNIPTTSSSFEPARITLETWKSMQKLSDTFSFKKFTYRFQLSQKFAGIDCW